MNSSFQEHFRCLDSATTICTSGLPFGDQGYFRFGSDVTCYGQTSTGKQESLFSENIHDALRTTTLGDCKVNIPFDLDQVVQNLRCEYYTGFVLEKQTKLPPHPFIRDLYYIARPLMSVGFRRILQKTQLKGKTSTPFPHWPVDRTVDRVFENLMILALQASGNRPIPFIWFWPDAAHAALILTHDVETETGRDFCETLMDLDESFGFRSSFQLIPEKRYTVNDSFLDRFRSRGFEINIHDLNHDGNLFRSHAEFLIRAKKINEYVQKFGISGFRSGVLYRNLRWYDAFDFSYDMSVPNVGHLDPQGGGCCTLFPYFVSKILEIPVTVTQDYSLFHILDTYSIALWQHQCELILKGNGMISIIAHPDYLIDEKSRATYSQLLKYLSDFCSTNSVWATLPREVNRWWRLRSKMELIQKGDNWEIEGEGKDRAKVAFAHLKNGHLVYSFDRPIANQQNVEVLAPVNPVTVTSDNLGSNFGGRSPFWYEKKTASQPTGENVQSREPKQPAAAMRDVGHSGAVALELEKEAPVQHSTVRPSRRPLRIGMVSYSFYENDNRVMRYAETLAKRGDYVEVFALQREDSPLEETVNGVHVHRLQGRVVNEKSVFSFINRILRFLFRATIRVSKNHLRQRYDLLHIHSVPDFMVFSGLLPRITGAPVILDIHDILPEFYGSKFGAKPNSLIFRLMLAVEKISTMFSSHVIIANDIWKERLLSRSVREGKCTTILNSPDRSIFQKSDKPRRSNDRFLLLYPGTLNWHQGLDLAIKAFSKISEQVPQADFYIYGRGPSTDDLKVLVKELELENRVFICETLPLREVAKIIGEADLGIVPKRKDNFGNEAFSTKILEFMAMGVPVIVSDTQIDRYYFDDSVVCFFRGGDADDLARCMLDLIRDSSKRNLLAANATQFVQRVDWTAKQHEYLQLVDQLVSTKLI